jgi:hypothetical protein
MQYFAKQLLLLDHPLKPKQTTNVMYKIFANLHTVRALNFSTKKWFQIIKLLFQIKQF